MARHTKHYKVAPVTNLAVNRHADSLMGLANEILFGVFEMRRAVAV